MDIFNNVIAGLTTRSKNLSVAMIYSFFIAKIKAFMGRIFSCSIVVQMLHTKAYKYYCK